MAPPGAAMTAAARRLGRAVIAAAKPTRAWTPSFERTLRHLLLSSPPPIPSLLHLARAHRIPLPPSSLHLAVSSLLFSDQPKDAFEVISLDYRYPPPLYNSLLAVLCSNGHLELARKLFDIMLQRGVGFNDLGFGVLIKVVGRDMDFDHFLRLVDQMVRQNYGINGSVVAVMIVDGLCRAGRIDEAWLALEELRIRGWKPDFIAYRIVAEEFRLAGRAEESSRILKQKRKLGVAPRMNDYREFLLLLISDRLVKEAKELGEEIIKGDFPVEDDVLNALIESVSAIDAESAVTFCNYMIEKMRFPSLATLSNLSRNFCENGKSDEMWIMFRNLLDKGYCLRIEHYNLLVSFLCRVGKVIEAYDVLKEMKKKSLTPDVSFYNYLIEACCREDLMRPAKKLWDEMFTNGCCANLETYNIFIRKFVETGDTNEAQQLYGHMVEKGVVPNHDTYVSLIKVLCREKRFEAALEIFSKSLEQDTVLASSALSTLILSLCTDGNHIAASGVMRSLPLDIDDHDSHLILLKTLANVGEVEMAIEHMRWVENKSPSKLEAIATGLLTTLSTAPKLEPVLHLLRALQSRGLFYKDMSWANLLEGDLLSTGPTGSVPWNLMFDDVKIT